MTFLSPALLWGLVGAAVPLVVHLIGRKQAPTVPFSAYEFLHEVVVRLHRREQFRQMLLLALRVLTMGLLAFALAGPGYRTLLAPTAAADTLIVIDASPSMAYRGARGTLFERAKQQAIDLLKRRTSGLAMVVVAGDEAEPLASAPTADTGALVAAIDKITLGERPSNVSLAVRRGLEFFKSGGCEVFVVSDLAAGAFAGADVMRGSTAQTLALIDAAERKNEHAALHNVAIGPAHFDSAPGDVAHLTVPLRNHGSDEAKIEVRLMLDGAVKARGFATLAAGAALEREFSLSDLSPGLHTGDVALVDAADGLDADNRSPIVIEVLGDPKVLLVNGDPKTLSFRDELYYLERALQSAEPPVQFSSITADDLATAKLDDEKVIVLANVPAPRESVAQALIDFVQKGGGLFIGLGDRVSFEAYNQALAPILPARLRDQWAVADPKAADAALQALGLDSVAWEHPIFRRFERALAPVFTQSHTYRHFFVDAGDLAKATRLLRFTSGAPALIERQSGKGPVILWTTTLDRDFSDFAIRPAYAPMMAQIARYLGGSLRSAPEQPLVAGVDAFVQPPPGVAPAYARRLDGKGEATLIKSEAKIRFWQPGVYAIFAAAKGGAPLEGSAFSVAPHGEESDYTPVSPRELAARWGVSDTRWFAQGTPAAASTRGDWTSYAHLALIGLALVFGLQSALARKG